MLILHNVKYLNYNSIFQLICNQRIKGKHKTFRKGTLMYLPREELCRVDLVGLVGLVDLVDPESMLALALQRMPRLNSRLYWIEFVLFIGPCGSGRKMNEGWIRHFQNHIF